MGVEIEALPAFTPDLYQRAWTSIPHPTLPLLATAHANSVTIFSLSTLSKHSSLTGGHSRSVRTVTWQPGLKSHQLRLVTGSFDASAGLWSFNGNGNGDGQGKEGGLEVEVTAHTKGEEEEQEEEEEEEQQEDWEFNLVLEGHENEIKSVSFSPSGQYLATCSRDKTVWIWEDVGVEDDDDEWETLAVLNEHDADVKSVAWCPDVPGRNRGARNKYSADVLASSSYDNTIRIWREEGEGEWVCVACLEGHGGTVWGISFEGRPRRGDKFPRLLSWGADGTIRVWSLKEEEEEEEENQEEVGVGAGGSSIFRSGLGGIPNTMRRSLREDWECTAVLPKVHTREIYSATWSAKTGMIASTGSDGTIALYAEVEDNNDGDDTTMTNTETSTAAAENKKWEVLTTVPVAHGPYEINHITWCNRFDSGTERKGEEEMLVTTGDDGVIRPWKVTATK